MTTVFVVDDPSLSTKYSPLIHMHIHIQQFNTHRIFVLFRNSTLLFGFFYCDDCDDDSAHWFLLLNKEIVEESNFQGDG